MKSHHDPFEQICDRLLRLERQNRRFKQLGATVLVATTSILLMGQASSHKTVEANAFILKDRLGRVRATLSVEELAGQYSAAKLVLFDQESKEMVKIDSGLTIPSGSLHLSDEHGQDRVYLGADSIFGGTLSLRGEKGAPGTLLQTNRASLPSVEATSISMIADGKRLSLSPRVIFFDRVQERQLIKEGLFKGLGKIHERIQGAPYAHFTERGLFVTDEQGKAMLTADGLSVTDDQGFGVTIGAIELTKPSIGEAVKRSAASIVLTDRDRTVLWKVP